MVLVRSIISQYCDNLGYTAVVVLRLSAARNAFITLYCDP